MARCYKSKAMRLTDEVLRDIWNNCYPRNCRLPSEETLAVRYNCSRMTMRKILTSLISDGILIKIPGSGTKLHPQLDLPVPPSADNSSCCKKIAAVMAAFPDILTIEVNRGIHDYAMQNGISFTLLQNTEGPTLLAQNLKQLDTDVFSGVIGFGTDAACNDQLRMLSEKGFPVVCVDNPVDGSAIPYIGVDNFGGMYSAAAHLLARSENALYYIGHRVECHSQLERYRGYCAAMTAYGMDELIPACSITIPVSQTSGKYLDADQERLLAEAAEKLLANPRPFGVVAECDYIARSILKTAEKMHLVPGEDFFIIGFDDLPQAEKMDLSSVHQPRYELGFEAARLLDQIINDHPVPGESRLLPVTLKLRGSSGRDH